jgi:hypothetical protein
MILEGLQNFGGGLTPQTPPRYATAKHGGSTKWSQRSTSPMPMEFSWGMLRTMSMLLQCQKHLEHYTHFTHTHKKNAYSSHTRSLHANTVLHTACLSTAGLHTIWTDHLKNVSLVARLQPTAHCPLWLHSSVAHNYLDTPHNCRKTFQMGPNHTVQY